jgi:hypothetical protein
MDATRSRPVPVSSAGADGPAQSPQDWEADITLIVASTLEPSCALAFCFGYDFGRRSPRGNSERSEAEAEVALKETAVKRMCRRLGLGRPPRSAPEPPDQRSMHARG